MTDQYAVIGHPVGHSKSPLIHKLFAQQFGMDMEYGTIDAEPGSFVIAVRGFQKSGGKGLNVTVPFKQEAFEMASALGPRAERAGAVNTLIFQDGLEIFGDNTDGIGLMRDLLVNQQRTLSGKNVLVVGAGGAVRGILGSMLNELPAKVVIANRTLKKAEELVILFSDLASVTASSLDAVGGMLFDIVINGTAASLEGQIPSLPEGIFGDQAMAYDLMYSDKETPFMKWSLAQGAETVVDGLGMLVEQAAESFYLWRGEKPDTKPVIEALRQN